MHVTGCGEDLGAATSGTPDSSVEDAQKPGLDAGADATTDANAPRDAASDAPPPFVCADAGDTPRHVRIMAGNLSSGGSQSYDEGSGIRIFQALKPDVAVIQEFNYKTGNPTDIREFVDAAFGPTFAYVRGPGAEIPNGVISRFPILDSGSIVDPRVSNRTFMWAKIDIPGDRDLWAYSVHLLTSSSSNRELEARALVDAIKAAVPANDFVFVGGDFNTNDRLEPCLTVFSEIFDTAAPYPDDGAGNSNTNTNRNKPYDWVLTSSSLRAQESPFTVGTQSFPSGFVLDTRIYTPLAELMPPLLGQESIAKNMQHMPVARDFIVSCK